MFNFNDLRLVFSPQEILSLEHRVCWVLELLHLEPDGGGSVVRRIFHSRLGREAAPL